MLFEPNDQNLILGLNPHTIGHEATGIVAQCGSGEVASKFKAGDPVGFICAVDCCFECYSCKNVHNAWCETGKAGMQGFSHDGYFQEWVCVDARDTIVLPEGCKLSFLLLLMEGMEGMLIGNSGCQDCGAAFLRWRDGLPWRG